MLTEQHFRGLKRLLERMPAARRPQVAMLTGSTKPRERRETLAALADGQLQILIGTHALISDNVSFAKLGLAVIDEQHKCAPCHSLPCAPVVCRSLVGKQPVRCVLQLWSLNHRGAVATPQDCDTLNSLEQESSWLSWLLPAADPSRHAEVLAGLGWSSVPSCRARRLRCRTCWP